MKKLILALAVVISTVGFVSANQSKVNVKSVIVGATHCYTMKGGAMYACLGATMEPMKANVTLANGTVVTTKGEVITRDGKRTALINGQCVDLNGNIADSAKHDAK